VITPPSSWSSSTFCLLGRCLPGLAGAFAFFVTPVIEFFLLNLVGMPETSDNERQSVFAPSVVVEHDFIASAEYAPDLWHKESCDAI
jgi:hypothetical protein